MLIEKSVNISTEHARALSGAKHQTSLAHAASLLLNNASQDLQLSVQLSLTFHRKRKRKTWRQWSETKLTQCNVTKQRGENLILFYVSVPVPTWSKKQKTIKPNGKECCLKGGGRRQRYGKWNEMHGWLSRGRKHFPQNLKDNSRKAKHEFGYFVSGKPWIIKPCFSGAR